MNLPVDWVENDAGETYSPADRMSIPWEDPELPVLVALFRTIRMILTRPGEFFQNLDTQGGLGAPLGFALILGTTGLLTSGYWQLIQLLIIGKMGSWLSLVVFKSFNIGPEIVVGMALLVPLLVVITQFANSLFLQLALLLVGGRDPSFGAAFRVLAYSHAPLVATFIPFLGGMIAGLWCLILEYKALVRVFELSSLWAVVALLLASGFYLMIAGFITLMVVGVLVG
ncbi:MAG: YIP1 family protein [Desulfobacca sp.]|nr:YIP1 family protein [Desulfobacca sp.]